MWSFHLIEAKPNGSNVVLKLYLSTSNLREISNEEFFYNIIWMLKNLKWRIYNFLWCYKLIQNQITSALSFMAFYIIFNCTWLIFQNI